MVGSTCIALAADHAGYAMKQQVCQYLREQGYEITDLGTHSSQSVDYPDFGRALGEHVAAGQAPFGVAICGTGIGISIAANRIKGVRAALASSPEAARLARAHNDANIIAFGARLTDPQTVLNCLQVFLETAFEGGRHQRRVDKLG